jgi:hypothetical protein
MTSKISNRDTALFAAGLMLHAPFSITGTIPTVLGNLVGGLAVTGLTLYATHVKTAPTRRAKAGRLNAAASCNRGTRGGTSLRRLLSQAEEASDA